MFVLSVFVLTVPRDSLVNTTNALSLYNKRIILQLSNAYQIKDTVLTEYLNNSFGSHYPSLKEIFKWDICFTIFSPKNLNHVIFKKYEFLRVSGH